MTLDRNYGKLKTAILDVLSDGKPRSADSILEMINEKHGISNISKSHLYTSIAQLINAGEKINKVGRGIYNIGTERIEEESLNEGVELEGYTEVLNTCNDLQKSLKKMLTFDLSEEKFSKYRKLFMLNQEYITKLKEWEKI